MQYTDGQVPCHECGMSTISAGFLCVSVLCEYVYERVCVCRLCVSSAWSHTASHYKSSHDCMQFVPLLCSLLSAGRPSTISLCLLWSPSSLLSAYLSITLVSFSLARSLSFSCWHFCGPKVQIVVISQEHLQLFVSWANDVSSGHLRIRWLDSLCSSELLGISEKRRETQECKIRAWTHKGTSNPPGVSAVKGKWLIRLLKLRLDILQ